jgi:hypothetical protein
MILGDVKLHETRKSGSISSILLRVDPAGELGVLEDPACNFKFDYSFSAVSLKGRFAH